MVYLERGLSSSVQSSPTNLWRLQGRAELSILDCLLSIFRLITMGSSLGQKTIKGFVTIYSRRGKIATHVLGTKQKISPHFIITFSFDYIGVLD